MELGTADNERDGRNLLFMWAGVGCFQISAARTWKWEPKLSVLEMSSGRLRGGAVQDW